MLKRYIDFIGFGNERLLENVQQAKDLLKKLEIQRRKEQGITDKLTEEEIKELEKDPHFIKIKDMLAQTSGLTYLFTKTFFKDWRDKWEGSEYEKDRCIEDLKIIYNRLIEKRDLWGLLPMTFDKYASIEPDEKDQRPSIERLTDDWREVLSLQNAKKLFINRLLPFQKKWFKDAPEEIVKRVKAIGQGFSELGMDDNGKIDPKVNKILNDNFFIKERDGRRVDYISRFQILPDLLAGAEDYIISSTKNGYKFMMEKIERANNKFGNQNGVDIVWEGNGFMLVEVKSFVANVEINSHTNHCIKDNLRHWNSYVDINQFRRQYYIYNFNLPDIDRYSVIGLTIDSDGKIISCFLKNDDPFLSGIESYINKNGIPRDAIEPYSKEEQIIVKNRIEANKILRKNVGFDEVKRALDMGGDVNVDAGLPLKNALTSGDMKVLKLLLERGARVNIDPELIGYINKNLPDKTILEIVSILVANGFQINIKSYRFIVTVVKGISIFEIIKIMLRNGLDPNILDGRLLRDGISRKDLEWVEALSKYNLNFAARNYQVLITLLQQGEENSMNEGDFKTELIDIIFSKFKEIKDDIFKNDEKRRELLRSRIISGGYIFSDGDDKIKAKRIKILLDKFVEYGASSDKEFVLSECKRLNDSKDTTKMEKSYLSAIIKEIEK